MKILMGCLLMLFLLPACGDALTGAEMEVDRQAEVKPTDPEMIVD